MNLVITTAVHVLSGWSGALLFVYVSKYEERERETEGT